MTEQTTVGASFAEAPVSWNTRYTSSQGFDCQLTLRGTDPAAVLKTAAEIMAKMADAGIAPASGNGHCKAQTVSTPAQGEAPLCPAHGTPMKPSQHGAGWYCPSKIAEDDGTGKPVYCKQRAK